MSIRSCQCACCRRIGPDCDDNARFIVKAVNHHEELVQMIKTAGLALAAFGGPKTLDLRVRMNDLLAKVEGTK